VTFESASLNESFKTDIEINYDKAKGNKALSETINSQIEKSIITSINSSENATDLRDALNIFNSEYLKFIEEFPDAAEPVWELSIETEVSYQSEDIISIAIGTYEYKGGAHGNDQIKFLNLNAKTGSVLEINDFLENNESFDKLAKSYFIKNLNDENENLKMEDFFFGKPFHLPENMGLCDEGLILLYNVYEVASYAQGYTEFVIPFEEVKPFLKQY
jgi:Protein of unknown function (DUF3298)/Deacetylase PdaC